MYESSDFEVSPGCSLWIQTGPTGLQRIEFGARGGQSHSSVQMREVMRQLRLYFAGALRQFELPLELIGTDFQKRVWNTLLTIPFGQTRSYTEIASQIGAPRAVRAVGAANGRNPIPIIVPCHRVIGASGSLVGFGGGLQWKRKLLELESNSLKKPGTLFSMA
jgi:methylated-DNA-[protein]-cysteine S-methyltransferase